MTETKMLIKKIIDTTDSLPKIGSPATNALAAIGITKLKQITKYSEKELLKIHGVGPKAIRILGEALKAKGLGYKK